MGSSPSAATMKQFLTYGSVAQFGGASDVHSEGRRFDPDQIHQMRSSHLVLAMVNDGISPLSSKNISRMAKLIPNLVGSSDILSATIESVFSPWDSFAIASGLIVLSSLQSLSAM